MADTSSDQSRRPEKTTQTARGKRGFLYALRSLYRAYRRGEGTIPPPGWVRFGSLRRTTPLSRVWGRDRGRSLDRYYIEHFLEENRSAIRGRVLEVGDSVYTRLFGGERVASSDVLHVQENAPGATIVADLTDAGHIPDESFDCIIFTQTLQLIYDAPAAIRTLHRILRPGGMLLSTFPGITHTGDADWHNTWYWSFTRRSALRLYGEVFGEEQTHVTAYGNVLAASAFLYGLSDGELRKEELDHHDAAYEVIVGVLSTKAAARR